MDLRRDINNKSFMDLRAYFLLFPSAFNRYLSRDINNKSFIDLKAYFSLFFFLKLVIDLQHGITTIIPL